MQTFGWYHLAKEVADYCNSSYFDIMEQPALEIAGLVMVINAKIDLIKNK
jgi:hypothetical protein